MDHFECEVHTSYEKKTFKDRLDLYGKLATTPRKKLIEYCLKLQDNMLKVDEELRRNGIIVTFDYENNIRVEMENKND